MIGAKHQLENETVPTELQSRSKRETNSCVLRNDRNKKFQVPVTSADGLKVQSIVQ